MNEIKCPNCQKVFKVDESGYENLLKQVRDQEFRQELDARMTLMEKEKQDALKLNEAQMMSISEKELSKKELEISDLKAQLDKINNIQNTEVMQLQSQLKQLQIDFEKQLELTKSNYELHMNQRLNEIENEKNKLAIELEAVKNQQQLVVNEAVSKVEKERVDLKNELNNLKITNQLELSKAVSELEKQRDQLANELKIEANNRENLKRSLIEQYSLELKQKDEQIEYYRDYKLKLSTKMVGESLEQHCEFEFEKLRATAFKNAFFQKDNDASSGSKGDYIYRDFDENGQEILSIMFEMKNENDQTTTKRKNEDFLKVLDRDRNEKNCEYAVLVSVLESESELYNTGIVDKSHLYSKTYVIRPQFFIPMITILKNASLNSMQYKTELAQVKAQNIDISNFEDSIEQFKSAFSKNYDLASRRFKSAIDEIDKTIKSLEKTKDYLLSSENNLRLANNKAEDLTIKKLTRNNPYMAQMFQDNKKINNNDQ